jgi:release factor glutamine methyltransferase
MSARALAAGTTVADARRDLAETFRRIGLDSSDLDARLIVGHALGLDHTALALAPQRILTGDEIDRIAGYAARRRACEPIARILGTQEFWGLPLRIGPAVLVPRPDTETVVEAALEGIATDRPLCIADLGTGSGAILLALLSELPHAHGIGTDRDPSALAVARANAANLQLADRAGLVASDYGAALARPFDLVVSNPPYVRTADIAALEPDVRQFDPRLALDGGADGLAAYRTIAADARRLLAPGARLVVEVGLGQAAEVAALFAEAGLATTIPPRRDLSGVPRAVTAICNPMS